jgi:outer membrane biogenesis lipoprotein LolB
MKKNALMILLLSFIAMACAHDTSREPASDKQAKEQAHRQHDGLFDRPYN